MPRRQQLQYGIDRTLDVFDVFLSATKCVTVCFAVVPEFDKISTERSCCHFFFALTKSHSFRTSLLTHPTLQVRKVSFAHEEVLRKCAWANLDPPCGLIQPGVLNVSLATSIAALQGVSWFCNVYGSRARAQRLADARYMINMRHAPAQISAGAGPGMERP